jgi:hypothetical protein
MRAPTRLKMSVGLLVIAAAIGNCTDALSPTADTSVILEQVSDWPATLSIAQIVTISASAKKADGSAIVGVDLDWSTSDSSVITIAKVVAPEQPASGDADAAVSSPGLSAVVTTHAAGTATIIATLKRNGFAPAQLRVPVVVDTIGWNTLVTVSRPDTAGIDTSKALAVILAGATVTWLTSDNSVLAVDRLASNPFRARLTPRRSGSVTITATVTGSRLGRAVLQLPVNVGALQAAQDTVLQWPALMTVSDSRVLTLKVRDALNRALASVPVQWRSTNTLAMAVDASTGEIKALREGGTEVIATVGDPNFQTTEYRAPITVGSMGVVEQPAWPDTLTVMDTTVLTAVVRDAAGVVRPSVRVRWTSTNPLVFKLDSIAPAKVRVTALSAGGGEIIATVGEGEFQASEHRATMLVLPLSITPTTTWPDTLTVTDSVSVTVAVAAAGSDPRATTVRWSSTNTGAFIVAATGTATARIIALSQGVGELVATVGEPPFQTTERRATIKVVPLKLRALAWPTSVNLGGSVTLKAQVLDAFGTIRTGRAIRWRSTNEAAFTIGGDGNLTPIRSGGGEIVASVGEAPFQTTELRAAFTVLTQWRSVDAGWRHTCAIALDKTAFCWGDNQFQELGSGLDVSQSSLPLRVATFFRFDEIAAGGGSFNPNAFFGEAHSCGISGTTLLCWGSTSSAQIGDGSGPCQPRDLGGCVQPLPTAAVSAGIIGNIQGNLLRSVFVGGRQSCAIAVDPTALVYATCWGFVDASVPWPLGRTGSAGVPRDTSSGKRPVYDAVFMYPDLIGIGDNIGIMTGGTFVCMKKKPAGITPPRVACRGDNRFGQSGDTIVVEAGDSIRVVRDVAGEMIFFSIPTAGARHACVINYPNNNKLICWGANEKFQLGTTFQESCPGGPCSTRARVVTVSDTEFVSSISGGGAHTCALTDRQNIYCWGSNAYGQLGSPTGLGGFTERPTLVTGGLRFASVTAGEDHTCGVTVDGGLYCWGRNDKGQLGNGTLIQSPLPVRVGEPGS